MTSRQARASRAARVVLLGFGLAGVAQAQTATFIHSCEDAAFTARASLGDPAPTAVYGSPTIVEGRYGGGLAFNGTTGDGLVFSGLDNIASNGATISLWFKPNFDSTNTVARRILVVRAGTQRLADLIYPGGSNAGKFQMYDGISALNSDVLTFSAGDWIRLGVSLKPGTKDEQLYVNGVIYTRGGAVGPSGVPDTLTLGCYAQNSGVCDGVIDNLYITDKVGDYHFYEEVPAGSRLTQWQHRLPITVDHGQVNEPLTNFPVLVRLNAGNFDFSTARVDGRDVRFTANDGFSALSFECESHDAVSETALYWVRIPHMSDTRDTTFFLYYGNAGASNAASRSDTWNTEYVGVWHLAQSPTDVSPQMKNSSLTVAADGTCYGEMTADDQVAGVLDNCLEFDGVEDQTLGDHVRVVRKSAYNFTRMTVSAWAKWSDGYWIAHQGLVSGDANSFGLGYDGVNLSFRTRNTNDNVVYLNYGITADKTDWHHYAATYDGAMMRLYRDGTLVATSDAQQGDLKWSNTASYDFCIGHGVPTTAYQNQHFQGRIDEVRLSNLPRSDAWIAASHANQRPDGTFLAVGVNPGTLILVR